MMYRTLIALSFLLFSSLSFADYLYDGTYERQQQQQKWDQERYNNQLQQQLIEQQRQQELYNQQMLRYQQQQLMINQQQVRQQQQQYQRQQRLNNPNTRNIDSILGEFAD